MSAPMLTGRLIGLRPMEVDDLRFLTDLANHPVVRANVVGWDWPVSHAAQADWLRAANGNPSTRRLTVTSPTGEPVGLTGLWELDWHNRSAVTGVKLMPGIAPKGAGSDSIMLMMAWAFHEVGLRRLHATILDFNAASLGAYVRKCGWRVEGREKQAIFRGGRWNDQIRVAALRADFESLPDAAEYIGRVCALPAVPEASAPRQAAAGQLEPAATTP
jgi:RimJ/RimL family protein N-acetyltransferase